MNLIEARYFQRNIVNLNHYARARTDYFAYFNELDALQLDSLQDIYFNKDLEYLSALPKIIDVISTIVAKPKISSKTEEVLMRASLVSGVSHETFVRTMQDAQLWKRKGLTMSPEYVYTHLSDNEIKIYENIFIVTLIDIIAGELKKYAAFYGNLVETFFGQAALSPLHNDVLHVLQTIDKLSRKIERLQNTSFYKIIRKQCAPLKSVHPTNILLKERAYNVCYKFYRARLGKGETQNDYDLQKHYYALVLKSLKSLGFTLQTNAKLHANEQGNFTIKPVKFAVAQFFVELFPYQETKGLVMQVTHRFASENTANQSSHLLLFSTSADAFSDLPANVQDLPYDTKAAISVWNLAYCKPNPVPVFRNAFEESSIVECWVRTKMDTLIASELYHNYCPVCGARTADFEEDRYVCDTCGAHYTTYQDVHRRENVWFINLTSESSTPTRFAPVKKSKLNTLNTQKVALWKMKQYYKTPTTK